MNRKAWISAATIAIVAALAWMVRPVATAAVTISPPQWEYAVLNGWSGPFNAGGKVTKDSDLRRFVTAMGGTVPEKPTDGWDFQTTLYDAIGAQGWELVAVSDHDMYFKRQKRN